MIMTTPGKCFHALGDARRLALFLSVANNPGINAADLGRKFNDQTRTNTWHHLNVLTEAELLVRSRQSSADVYYMVNPEVVGQLLEYLTSILNRTVKAK